jgi:hypothetical protein
MLPDEPPIRVPVSSPGAVAAWRASVAAPPPWGRWESLPVGRRARPGGSLAQRRLDRFMCELGSGDHAPLSSANFVKREWGVGTTLSSEAELVLFGSGSKRCNSFQMCRTSCRTAVWPSLPPKGKRTSKARGIGEHTRPLHNSALAIVPLRFPVLLPLRASPLCVQELRARDRRSAETSARQPRVGPKPPRLFRPPPT